MSYSVLIHPKAVDELSKIDEPFHSAIRGRLVELKKNPDNSGTRLKGSRFWRTRIRDYRAKYEIKPVEKQVIILFVGHRRNVYDDFSKLV